MNKSIIIILAAILSVGVLASVFLTGGNFLTTVFPPLPPPTDSITKTTLPSLVNIADVYLLNSKIFVLSKAYETDSPTEAAVTINSLKQVLVQRKALMFKLAEENPQAFLNAVVPNSVKNSLPVALASDIEKPVVLGGAVDILHFDDFKNAKTAERYFLTSDGVKYSLYFAGGKPNIQSSGAIIRVSGYQIEDRVVAGTGDNNVQTTSPPPPVSPETVGPQQTMVALVKFLDSPLEPFTRDTATNLVFNDQFQNFYKETSYGKMSWVGEARGWYTFPRNGAMSYEDPNDGKGVRFKAGVTYTDCSWPGIDETMQALQADGVDLTQYGRLIILAHHGCMGGGFSGVGKWYVSMPDGRTHRLSISWVGSLDYYSVPSWWGAQPFSWTNLDYLLSHELGHGLGAWHANSWECGVGNSLYGNCNHIEYGNFYDVMGAISHSLSINAFYKELFGWLDQTSLLTVAKTGRYKIMSLNSTSSVRAIKIQQANSNMTPFYIELRKAKGFDANLSNPALTNNQNGIFVNWLEYSGTTPASSPRLLDMTPVANNDAYPSGFDDWKNVTLNAGKIFNDPDSATTIKNVAADSVSSSFDVALGTPTCTMRAPRTSYYYPTDVTIDSSSWFWISFELKNINNSVCSQTNFQINPMLPVGWTYSGPTGITLSSGKSYWVQLEIFPKTGDPAGKYSITVDAVNLANKAKTIAGTTNVQLTGAASINVLYPNGGEQILKGSTQTLQWNSTPNITQVNIRFLNGTTTAASISNVPNSGSYNWVVPDITPSSNYKMRIIDANLLAFDDSDKPFSIVKNNSPVGKQDGVSNTNCRTKGWTADPNDPNKSISFRVYYDAAVGAGGKIIGDGVANLAYAGLAYPGNHGFSYDIPAPLLRDGKSHPLYVYGIDAQDGKLSLLGGSPKTITCPKL